MGLMAITGAGLATLATRQPGSHVVRSIAGVGAMFSYFGALSVLPLADVTAIGFASPLFVVALSALILGEAVHALRWSAVGVGFLGVLIMISPHLGASTGAGMPVLGIALALAAAVFTAFVMVFIRRMSETESALAIAFYFQLTCTAVSLAALAFGWRTPDLGDLTLLVLVGVLGGFGQLFMTNSYRFAQASVLANFDYAAMIWAILLGWLFFGELPASAVYFGAALVIAAGGVIAWRERRLGIERARERAARPV
jgi:drug/metabolite transporter (DMT)-like permease